jgi:hypothetical protein
MSHFVMSHFVMPSITRIVWQGFDQCDESTFNSYVVQGFEEFICHEDDNTFALAMFKIWRSEVAFEKRITFEAEQNFTFDAIFTRVSPDTVKYVVVGAVGDDGTFITHAPIQYVKY